MDIKKFLEDNKYLRRLLLFVLFITPFLLAAGLVIAIIIGGH